MKEVFSWGKAPGSRGVGLLIPENPTVKKKFPSCGTLVLLVLWRRPPARGECFPQFHSAPLRTLETSSRCLFLLTATRGQEGTREERQHGLTKLCSLQQGQRPLYPFLKSISHAFSKCFFPSVFHFHGSPSPIDNNLNVFNIYLFVGMVLENALSLCIFNLCRFIFCVL